MEPNLEQMVIAVFAITFYRIGKREESPALLWAVLSIAFSLTANKWFQWGLQGIFVSQILLFVAITVYRVDRDSR